MSNFQFRTAYDFFGPRGDLDFGDEPSLTVQSAADECDINLIVDRARRGIAPPTGNLVPQYFDVSDIGDYADCQRRVEAANAMFASLPALLRDKLNNNPAMLESYIADPANRADAERYGLLRPSNPVVDNPPVSPLADGKPEAALAPDAPKV